MGYSTIEAPQHPSLLDQARIRSGSTQRPQRKKDFTTKDMEDMKEERGPGALRRADTPQIGVASGCGVEGFVLTASLHLRAPVLGGPLTRHSFLCTLIRQWHALCPVCPCGKEAPSVGSGGKDDAGRGFRCTRVASGRRLLP